MPEQEVIELINKHIGELVVDKTTIHKGERICQFEIVPNQFATMWQKLKWLFSSNIEFEWVDNLGNADRGGHGKTGVK